SGRASSAAQAPESVLTRLLLFPWRLFAGALKWLWRFTFQRWWNFVISIPAFAALLAGLGALTVADVGMVIAVTILIGFRAGIVELAHTLRRPAPTPLKRRG